MIDHAHPYLAFRLTRDLHIQIASFNISVALCCFNSRHLTKVSHINSRLTLYLRRSIVKPDDSKTKLPCSKRPHSHTSDVFSNRFSSPRFSALHQHQLQGTLVPLFLSASARHQITPNVSHIPLTEFRRANSFVVPRISSATQPVSHGFRTSSYT